MRKKTLSLFIMMCVAQNMAAYVSGYGVYHGDSYLYRYIINEGEAVKDSTDFARWNDKTVICLDVDSIGENAFSEATFRQGQILYFTERLRYIGKDAFTGVKVLNGGLGVNSSFGDLCIVFSGATPPSIADGYIANYANPTYRMTYVVPNLPTYIVSDIQWTYTQMVTIDDFIKGNVSPENEVMSTGSIGVDLFTDVDDENKDGKDGEDGDIGMSGSGKTITIAITARSDNKIPVRIGGGDKKGLYSRAPAWMNYTVDIKITSTNETELYAQSKVCGAQGECHFTAEIACPSDDIVLVWSRTIDPNGKASDWTTKRVNLNSGIEGFIAPKAQTPCYDLMGREIANPTRGVYIKDGRKVVIK